jgi:hypothetical protein
MRRSEGSARESQGPRRRTAPVGRDPGFVLAGRAAQAERPTKERTHDAGFHRTRGPRRRRVRLGAPRLSRCSGPLADALFGRFAKPVNAATSGTRQSDQREPSMRFGRGGGSGGGLAPARRLHRIGASQEPLVARSVSRRRTASESGRGRSGHGLPGHRRQWDSPRETHRSCRFLAVRRSESSRSCYGAGVLGWDLKR